MMTAIARAVYFSFQMERPWGHWLQENYVHHEVIRGIHNLSRQPGNQESLPGRDGGTGLMNANGESGLA
jgi:hypothetical protein